MLETSLGSIARLKDFEITVTPEDNMEQFFEPPADWPNAGAIQFRNVTASYG
jgi:hypothetical protein